MSGPDVELHTFNDDLLLSKEDRSRAARVYPTIVHVLDHPDLRRVFKEFDEPSNLAKRAGRNFGLAAIGLVFLALCLASLEHPLGAHLGTSSVAGFELNWQIILAVAAGTVGIIGAAIGSVGVLHARKKLRWLYQRLMTERTRQFHFQSFVLCSPEILASLDGPEAQDAFREARNKRFEAFVTRYRNKLAAEIVATVKGESRQGIWLHEHNGAFLLGDHVELVPLFRAYRELRIVHQLGYASYKLRDDYRIFSDSARRQAAVLATMSLLCVTLLCAVHAAVIAAVLLSPSIWAALSGAASTLAIAVALSALAVRAIEEGLQPERELERYTQYQSAIRAILDRFDSAPSQREKLGIMLEMERLVFDEMQNFLIGTERSRFVM